MHKLTSSELCFTSLQCFIKSASRSPVFREKTKICVPHDCSASHDCIWTSTVGFVSFGLYLVSNKTCKNKTLVSPCQKKVAHPPFKLDWRRPETCKTKTKTVPPATHIPKSCIMQAKTNKKRLFGFGCSMRHAKKKRTCSGVLSSSTNCSQNGFCQFFVIHTGCCPVDIIHPCMPFTLAPTKTPCEQIAKTS